ncbi:MAG: Lrp/AsnC family transcriptional regulator [Nocardioidaceae bacterium]|nr:Lrp/AsnC family transcriptional regulator [Nocardioidaceae bacterium]
MDHVDEAIVEQLETDGRLSHLAIAERVGISRVAVATRLQRLVASGQVEVRGVVHPAVLQRGTVAYFRLAVDGPAAPVAAELAARDDMPLVSLVTGSYDLVAEVRTASAARVDEVAGTLRALPRVRTAEVLSYVEVLRDVVGPTGEVGHTLDDTDIALLAALQDDGRASYVDLAAGVGLSPAGARRRVLRLLEGNVVRVGVVVRQTGRDPMLGLGVRLTGPHEPVVEALLARPAVLFAARTLGAFDLLLTLRAHAADHLAELLDAIRALPGVHDVESWSHLHVVKESYASTEVIARRSSTDGTT